MKLIVVHNKHKQVKRQFRNAFFNKQVPFPSSSYPFSLSFISSSPLDRSLILIPFFVQIFPSCAYVQLNFADQKNSSSAFYYPIQVMLPGYRYDLSHSSCYPARIEVQLVLNPTLSSNQQLLDKFFDYIKRFTITRDKLQSLENCFHIFGTPTASQFNYFFLIKIQKQPPEKFCKGGLIR